MSDALYREAPPIAPSSETLTQLRIRLRAAGFSPIPVEGKHPSQKGWPSRHNQTDAEIALWDEVYPSSKNTGLLSEHNPAIDIDIPDEGAAEALEDLAREHF